MKKQPKRYFSSLTYTLHRLQNSGGSSSSSSSSDEEDSVAAALEYAERKRRGRSAWVRSGENTPPPEPALETDAAGGDYETLLAQMQALGLPTNFGNFAPA